MKKAAILLKEKLSGLLEVLQGLEQADAEPSRLDCDVMLASLREAYQLVLDINKPEPVESEPIEQKIDRMVESRLQLQSENQQQLLQQLEQHIDSMLDSKLTTLISNKIEVHQPESASPVTEEPVVAEPEPKQPEVIIPDAEEEPVFAPEEPQAEPALPYEEQTMEQAEGKQNEELFEEPDNQPAVEQETPKESGTTLWDMLQPKQGTTSVADRFKPGQSLVDQYKQADSTPIAEKPQETTPVAETAPVTEPTPQPADNATTGSLFELLHQEQNAHNNAPSTRTLADQLSDNKPNVEQSLEEKVNAHKVADLRTVISISDKFQFMNDLFHNNMKAYNDFILKLNAASGREAGLEVLSETAAAFNWDKDSLTVKKFQTIFDRKF